MYRYISHHELGGKLEKDFDELEDGKEFATENLNEHPEYRIVDLDDMSTVWSNKLADEEDEMHIENMFPEGDPDDDII